MKQTVIFLLLLIGLAAHAQDGAKNINKRDRYGNLIRLQDYKGKYVLLDFWGSWCAPCRKGNPHLKELYAKYHEKGFEIIGIANENEATLSEARSEWLQAIQKDGLPWVNILNNEGIKDNNVVAAYAVNEYPTKILIGPDGKIVSRLIGIGPANVKLEALLKKIYKQ